MAKPTTYIKLDRKILSWQWYTDANTMRVFIHLLLNANIKARYFENNLLERGELATSYMTISEELEIGKQQVRTAFMHLKRTGEITCRVYPKFQIVHINNYEEYQGQVSGIRAKADKPPNTVSNTVTNTVEKTGNPLQDKALSDSENNEVTRLVTQLLTCYQHGEQHSEQHGAQHSEQHGEKILNPLRDKALSDSENKGQHGEQHSEQHGAQHGNQHQSKNNKEFKELYIDIYSSVIQYLNKKAYVNYRASSEQTKKLINARLNDGYTEKDFYTVIDKKCAEWMGTDFEKYLRPSTLFSATHFPEYLNAKTKTIRLEDVAGNKNSGSFDTDDFFAAALNKSKGDKQ